MTEKIQIKGKDVWITVEPHVADVPENDLQEYFTATYFSADPANNRGGVIFVNEQKLPCVFNSPVQALEYASEKLLGII